MATEKKNKQLFRVMSLDGSVLYKNVGFTATKSGTLYVMGMLGDVNSREE